MALDDSWMTTDFRDEHLAGILLICEAEGWPSLPANPARARRALRAPGVRTFVATNSSGQVVGFAQVLSDGEFQGHLALLAVRADSRRRGVAHSLLAHVFNESPDMRFDTLNSTEGESFYASLHHRRMSGFRFYPESMTDQDSNTTT